MSETHESRLKIEHVPVDQLEPNPWNPNKLDSKVYVKLRAYIAREGFVEPIVVRKAPKARKYQILGGYHRWQIAQELGHKTIPAVIVKLSDHRAKILSVNLNQMHGEVVPNLMAELLHDLSREVSLEDLETQLPFDLGDLRDLTDLLKIPDGLDLKLEEEAEDAKRDAMKVLSFPLNPKQLEVVEKAIDTASEATTSTSRSVALTHVAREYLAGVEEEQEHEREEVGE